MRALAIVAGLVAIGGVAVLTGLLESDETVDVHAVEDAPAPPRDAELAEAAWPRAAAWIRRESEQGRPVVMNIFASWCDPCERELPLLNRAARDNPEIAFLGIDHLDQRSQAEEFVEEQEVAFPTLFDIGGDVAANVGARAMPTTVFFDADGRVVSLAPGELSEDQLEQRLAEIR